MNRKGFTLVELLATILIIGLVLGLTAYGIISSVGSAKDTGTTLSLSGIKEAARTYSNEAEENRWKKSNINNYTYFCVTTEELINKGLLDKKASKIENGDIKLNDYIVVIKDYTTKVIKREEVLNTSRLDEITKDAYGYCTGSIKPENIIKDVSLEDSTSKTDKIEVNYIDAEFKTDNEVNKINEVSCLYGDNTQVIEESTGVTIDKTNKKCKITGLKQNTPYYVQVCMTSENGSKSCSTPESVNTKTIKEPNININNNNSIKITYYETDITTGEASYYFKSNVKGESAQSVLSCTLNEGIYTCSNSTTSISENTWYKTTNKEVVLTYKDSGNITVTAETRDKSNNYKQSSKDFSLYKIIFTFNKDTADTIGGQSDNIEKLCIANKGNSCSITSPSIERSGYNIIGWNTNSSATVSSWNVNTSKNISTSTTYYPIVKISTYTISYNANGGSNAPSSQTKNYNVNITLSSSKPTRVGYTFTGWNTKTDGTGTSYASGATYSSNSDVTLYAQWKVNKINIYYHMNGGTLKSNNSSFGTSGNYVTLNGNTLIESYNYGDKLGTDGLYNYNNSGYINIVRDGYKAVSGSEWYNQDGKKFSQSTIYNANDLCDASKADCAATLYVNWVKEDSINGYRCSSSDFYYITTCDTSTCKFTSKNGSNESGTISKNSLSECLTSKYITANSGLNCRLGAGSSYGIVTAYSCGTLVEVINKPINGWWYSLNSNCYMSGDYLSNSKPSCSSGGGGDGGSSGGLDNGCPTSTPNKITKGDTVYCCPLGVTVPSTATCQAYKGGADEGYLASCTCNNDKDCGTAGTKYRDLRCDKSRTSGSTTGGKYMCTWGTPGNSDVYHCW